MPIFAVALALRPSLTGPVYRQVEVGREQYEQEEAGHLGQPDAAIEDSVQACLRDAQEHEQDAGPDLNPALAVHDPRVEPRRRDQASQAQHQAGVGDHRSD